MISFFRAILVRALSFGDLTAPSALAGQSTWKQVTLAFLSILLGLMLFMLCMAPGRHMDLFLRKVHALGGILPVLSMACSALAVSFFQEFVFRGLLLPLFEKTLGSRGNLLQALLFGILHIDCAHPANSLLKTALYTFMGWFWGRAAKETGGTGAGWIMHSALILIQQVRTRLL